MRALVFFEHGDLDQLKIADVPRPQPGPGQVQVRIKASALNHLDSWVRRGWPGLNLAMPHILGADGAGVVAAIGEGVTAVEVGTRCAIDPGISGYQDNYTRRGLDSVSPGYIKIDTFEYMQFVGTTGIRFVDAFELNHCF